MYILSTISYYTPPPPILPGPPNPSPPPHPLPTTTPLPHPHQFIEWGNKTDMQNFGGQVSDKTSLLACIVASGEVPPPSNVPLCRLLVFCYMVICPVENNTILTTYGLRLSHSWRHLPGIWLVYLTRNIHHPSRTRHGRWCCLVREKGVLTFTNHHQQQPGTIMYQL